MTWVLGWPLYDDDALEVANKHNLVKDPEAGDWKRIQTARCWVARKAGFIPGLSCWVGTMPELVMAAYVDYGDNPDPPEDEDLDREELMSKKQYRRLQNLMPLKDFGWYQHNDPSCTLYKEIVYEYDDDEEEDQNECEDAEIDEEVVDDDGASDWEDEDAADSDTETVTGSAAHKSST